MSERLPTSRPNSASWPASVPPENPPVPDRKDSLQGACGGSSTTKSNTSKAHKSDKASRASVSITGSTSTLPGLVNTLSMSTIDTLVDDPSASHTYEAKTLHREAFKVLHEFFQCKQLCDVDIKVGKRSIQCHRVVLACISRYFKTMFTSEMAESHKNEITIQDIDEEALQHLINFAYTSKITLTVDNVQSLLYASSILQIESVATACCQFMRTHLHPSNVIGVRNFAEQHGRRDLMDKADQFAKDHFIEVIESEEYTSMLPQHLKLLVESDELNVISETQVYEAVMKWVKHDAPARKEHLPALLSKLKLPLLPASYLVDKVSKDELLRQNMDCRDSIDEAKYYHMSLANVLPDVKLSGKILPRKSCAGVVFCVGGRGASGDPFKTIECYDIRKDRWFQVTEMSMRRRHVGVVSINGKLYAIGGHDGTDHLNTGEIFDPLTNKWKPISPMITLRRGIALACLGGPIYAVGGLDDASCFNIVERYDPESDTWSLVQAMNMPRGGVAVAALKGYLYALGGNDGAVSLESCERYDPHLNKWSHIVPMGKRRAGAGVAVLTGILYVVGGFDDNAPLDSVEKYEISTNTWTMVAKMSTPRGGVGVAALGGKIYAVGGHDGSNYLNSVEAYDPLTDVWENVAHIGTCRAGAGIAMVDCHIDNLKDTSKVNMSAAAGRL